jgi:hypothetical protein
MRKKALMELLMKSQAWFSSFRCYPVKFFSLFWGSNENTVINFPT